MNVLLVSTYELGHQPLGITGPAAILLAAGHEVLTVDLAVEPWPDSKIALADSVVFSIPMHTATEIAMAAALRIRKERPELPFAFHGLYARVLEGNELLKEGDLLVAGDASNLLVDFAAGNSRPSGHLTAIVELGPSRPPASPPPARTTALGLEHYNRLLVGDRESVAASVESSRGCNHTCGHCPVAVVYRGRSRPVALESVTADLAQVVTLGAEHVSFADPDFLNRPAHALAVAKHLAATYPGLSFDATIKVEHLLRHQELVRELGRLGLSFVVSAFESTDNYVLEALSKGHCYTDEAEAVALCRSAGVEIRPSWLPFTPWTTKASFAELLDFSARADLVANTDLVQYSIRLLLPAGSLLLEDPDPRLAASLGGVAPGVGSVAWRHADPAIDELQRAVAGLVEEGGASFEELWMLARDRGVPIGSAPPECDPALASSLRADERPRLSEAWFCCAEPTRAQLQLLR